MRTFSMLLLGIPTVAFAAWGVFCIARGAWLTAMVAVVLAVFWGSAASTWAIMPTSIPFATSDESGTTVRPDRRVDGLMLVCIIAGIFGLGGLGVFGSLGWLTLPIPADMDDTWMFLVPFVAPAIVGIVTLWITIRRGGLAYARLTPEGFEFAERLKTRSGEWVDVVGVANEAPDVPQATSPLVVHMADGSTVMLMESALLGPRDGLYHLIDFIWRNPSSRSELRDGRAVARLLAI